LQSVLAVFVGKEKYTLDQLGEVLNRFSPNADDLKKDVVQILNTFDNIEDIVDGNDGSSSGYTDTDEVDHSDDEGDNTHESDATHSSGTESDGPFEEKNVCVSRFWFYTRSESLTSFSFPPGRRLG
jgi:hypothetical protein